MQVQPHRRALNPAEWPTGAFQGNLGIAPSTMGLLLFLLSNVFLSAALLCRYFGSSSCTLVCLPLLEHSLSFITVCLLAALLSSSVGSSSSYISVLLSFLVPFFSLSFAILQCGGIGSVVCVSGVAVQ